MKKALLVLSLLVIIFISFSLVILRLLSNGSENNFFNTKYRSDFAQYPLLRKALGLHFDGDGKQDYLGSRYSKILIEVDRMEGLEISNKSLDLLSEKIKEITGKNVQVVESDTIPYREKVSSEEMDALVKQYQNENWDRNAAKLYLLYLSEIDDEIDQLGSTYKEYGILISATALEKFTQPSPKTIDNYFESTALHEFGHQIGLDHDQHPDCLMGQYAEMSHIASESPEEVIIDFCDYEKQLINAIKNR